MCVSRLIERFGYAAVRIPASDRGSNKTQATKIDVANSVGLAAVAPINRDDVFFTTDFTPVVGFFGKGQVHFTNF